MRTYGQYCPIARGAEIFAERWTPLIIRNLYLGCEKLQRDPGGRARALPHPALAAAQAARTARHRRVGTQARRARAPLPAHAPRVTTCSRSASRSASGAPPGSRSPPSTSIPSWRCGRCATCSAETGSRIGASSSGSTSPAASAHERYWLLIEHGDTEICKTYPGLDEDLYITAEAEAFVKWHAGQLTWAEATRDRRIQLHGPSWLVRAFPTWNARSMFAHIKPVSRTAGFGVTAELDGVSELGLQLREEPGAGGAGSTSPRSPSPSTTAAPATQALIKQAAMI